MKRVYRAIIARVRNSHLNLFNITTISAMRIFIREMPVSYT